jgi:hypothetical protein
MTSTTLIAKGRPGHPFRATVNMEQAAARRASDDGDLRLFVVSFTAFFVCIYTFVM